MTVLKTLRQFLVISPNEAASSKTKNGTNPKGKENSRRQ
jgi:hypothetical protein